MCHLYKNVYNANICKLASKLDRSAELKLLVKVLSIPI
nr:MAG TPA: hypothetical protein [Crassvirales sp.]